MDPAPPEDRPAPSRPALVDSDGPVVYVDDVHDPVLDEEDAHHLHRVLRLKPGDPYVVCDGAGTWRQLRYGSRPDQSQPAQWEPPPVWPIGVSTAIPKGERSDWMIQKLTELGVDELTFIDCERSVVRWRGERAVKQRARAERIVRAAAAQSRRARLPTLRGPLPVAAAATEEGVARAAVGAGPISPGTRNVMIGPEGGWSPSEVAMPLPTVGLGPQVLRTETAAIAASTLLVLVRSQLVLSASRSAGNTLGG